MYVMLTQYLICQWIYKHKIMPPQWVKELVAGMTNADPRHRMTAKEAYEYFISHHNKMSCLAFNTAGKEISKSKWKLKEEPDE